jgi:hypothetical protein
MCDPATTALLAKAGTAKGLAAISAAGATMSVIQSRAVADAQRASREMARNETARSVSELGKRQLQEQAAQAQQQEQIERDAMRAMSSQAASMAMQSGSGASYQAVINEVASEAAKSTEISKRNLENTLDVLEGEKTGLAQSFAMQPAIMDQGLLAEALSIGGAAVSGYATGKGLEG